MKLKISNDISLPIEAVTQTMAIIARKRVGKTYTASVVAEEMMKAKVPIVVLDPTGAWWGLRSSSDGKHDGFPVVIIGGAHADVPLEEHAGKIIADLVVDKPGFYILDFSQIESDAAMQRVATDFGNRFYFKKEQARFPMTLIVDEADVFMPQNPYDGEKKMLGIFDRICRRGGIRGIGMILISQRPAVLNKNVLTQCETLITLQISGSQDVDALAHWTKMHGSKEERDEYNSTIGSLQRGEAWIWSPSWLQVFKRIKIRERETFNSSATPKVGEKQIIPEKLAAIDIERLGEQIRAAAESVKANDPSELKKKIHNLERELKNTSLASTAMAATPVKVETKTVPALTDAERKRLTALIDSYERLETVCTRIEGMAEEIKRDDFTNRAEVTFFKTLLSGKLTPPTKFIPVHKPVLTPTIIRQPARTIASAESSNDDIALGKCERTLLSVLAKYPDGCTKNKLILLAGYCWSGSTQNALGKLRGLGLIQGENSGTIQITESGMASGNFKPLPEGEALVNYWLTYAYFGKCERSLLRCLIDNPKGLSKEDLLAMAGYEWSGSTQNALGSLRTAGVIVGRNNEIMRAMDEFFQ